MEMQLGEGPIFERSIDFQIIRCFLYFTLACSIFSSSFSKFVRHSGLLSSIVKIKIIWSEKHESLPENFVLKLSTDMREKVK